MNDKKEAGVELPPLPNNPEPTFKWTQAERDVIETYGRACIAFDRAARAPVQVAGSVDIPTWQERIKEHFPLGTDNRSAVKSACMQAEINELRTYIDASRIARPAAGLRDWPEDFAQENGQYENRCLTCTLNFMGNKHRRICKVCSSASPATSMQGEAVARVRISFEGKPWVQWFAKPEEGMQLFATSPATSKGEALSDEVIKRLAHDMLAHINHPGRLEYFGDAAAIISFVRALAATSQPAAPDAAAVRDKALEEAAKVCDFSATWAQGEIDDESNSDSFRSDYTERKAQAEQDAAAIRALRSPPVPGQEGGDA